MTRKELLERYAKGERDFRGADLCGADLCGACLGGADLGVATLPDGRTFEEWQADPFNGLCQEPEIRERALAAWGNNKWTNCPMHAAYGWGDWGDVPIEKALAVYTFIALHDAGLLEKPTEVGI